VSLTTAAGYREGTPAASYNHIAGAVYRRAPLKNTDYFRG